MKDYHEYLNYCRKKKILKNSTPIWSHTTIWYPYAVVASNNTILNIGICCYLVTMVTPKCTFWANWLWNLIWGCYSLKKLQIICVIFLHFFQVNQIFLHPWLYFAKKWPAGKYFFPLKIRFWPFYENSILKTCIFFLIKLKYRVCPWKWYICKDIVCLETTFMALWTWHVWFFHNLASELVVWDHIRVSKNHGFPPKSPSNLNFLAQNVRFLTEYGYFP